MDRMRTKTVAFLRWSEKYFKTDMVYLAHGGFWLTAGQIITAGASFVLSIAFANLFPKAVYGTYRYVLSVASTLSAFSLTGVGTAVVQSVARGFENVIKSAFWMNVRWSALLVAISLGGSMYYFLQGNIVLSVSLLFIGSFSPFLNSAHLATYYANGKKDFKRLSVYNIVKGVVPALILIITVFLTQNVLIIIFVYFLANTAIALLTYRDALRFYKPNRVDDPQILDYSKKLSVISILSTITAQADKILIFTSIGSAELATYAIAVAFPEQIKAALRNLTFLMIPKFAERDPEHVLELRGKIMKMGIMLLVITVAYVIVTPVLYKIFFPAYVDAISFSQLYGISIFSSLAIIPTSILTAHKRDKSLLRVNTIGSIIQLALLGIGIYFGALWGVVIAKVVAAYVYMFLFFFYVSKHHRL